jgi:hypothetical protein
MPAQNSILEHCEHNLKSIERHRPHLEGGDSGKRVRYFRKGFEHSLLDGLLVTQRYIADFGLGARRCVTSCAKSRTGTANTDIKALKRVEKLCRA